MNTSLLSNPKPSLGQNKPFGPRADKGPRRGQSGGAPSFQEFLNPTLHNSHGRTSNPTVSYPFMTRPFKSGGGRPLEGEILFSLRQEAKKAGAGFLITTVPLSFLNAKLFEQSSRVAGPPKASTFAFALETINTGVDPIGSDLNFLGVLRNEAIAPSRHQKLINVDVRGRTRIRNIWKGVVRTGEKLFLRVRFVNSLNYGIVRPSGVGPAAGINLRQIVPITLTEKLDESARGAEINLKLIRDIYIGTVMNAVHRLSADSSKLSAVFRPEEMKKLDFIEVGLKIGQ
jgi:hypothetical protein